MVGDDDPLLLLLLLPLAAGFRVAQQVKLGSGAGLPVAPQGTDYAVPKIDEAKDQSDPGDDRAPVGCFSPGQRSEQLAAGLLMLAGPVDLDELDRWLRNDWERRPGSTVPYGLSDAS